MFARTLASASRVCARAPRATTTTTTTLETTRVARVSSNRDAPRARASSNADDAPAMGFDDGARVFAPPGFTRVLFAECGFGADQHGQRATKAATRACRNAIEFNSIPSIRELVPGGYAGMKIHVHLGVPEGFDVDVEKVREVFPYGEVTSVDVDRGGLKTRSWIELPAQGDDGDDFIVCVANVSVGY